MTHIPPRGTGDRPGRKTAFIAASLAMLSWLVPDIATTDPVFPLSGISSAGPATAAGLLAVPAAGALCLIALLLPGDRRSTQWTITALSLLGLWLSLSLREPTLPLFGPVVAGIGTLSVVAGAVAIWKWRARILAIALGFLPPLGLLIFSLVAVISGEQPLSFAAPYREALSIWCMAALGISGVGMASSRY